MIKRSQELKELEEIYSKAGNQMVLMYGSHRSGISNIVKDFIKGKRNFYYMAANASNEQQLSILKGEIQSKYDIKLQKNTYEECFTRIKSGDASKLVVVIDEFSRITKHGTDFFNSLVKLRDKELYPGPVMILMVNRDLSNARENISEYLSIDYKIEVSDYHFLDIVRGFPKYSVDECVRAYGIFGGTGAYLDMIDSTKSIKENVCKLVLSSEGALFNEAEDYIHRELRELGVYNTILYTMAKGKEKLNDLYKDTGYSRAKISVYLKNLSLFDVTEKVISFDAGGWDNAKKGIYRIRNRFIEFWFCFIYPHQSDLFTMEPEDFYDKYIEENLDRFLNRTFAVVCREYIELLNMMDKLPIPIKSIGTWLGKEGTIDIVGQSDSREHILGICNWAGDEMKIEEYERLMENAALAKLSPKAIYLFSSKNFDIRLKALEAKNKNINLIDMSQL